MDLAAINEIIIGGHIPAMPSADIFADVMDVDSDKLVKSPILDARAQPRVSRSHTKSTQAAEANLHILEANMI